MAFSAPIAAFAATQDRMDKFNALFRFGITPLFLFSGTFFPVEQLPGFLQPLAWVTPLWHGVELCRGLSLGTIGADPLLDFVHLAVLALFAGGGLAATLITFRRRLVK
jgi:lipooligosaccharide transport system permease protein